MPTRAWFIRRCRPDAFALAMCLMAGSSAPLAFGQTTSSGGTSGHPFRVVTTGDSLTLGYSPIRLQQTFDAVLSNVLVLSAASGGCDSRRYVGYAIDPTIDAARDYVSWVLSLDPDAIVFMLGTNDAAVMRADPGRFDEYTLHISRVFDRFASSTNLRGRRPIVFVCTLIPVLSDDPGSDLYVANLRIEDTFNPWLREQAVAYQFRLVDMCALITSVPGWQGFYSSDGVHLHANDDAGFWWMAERVAARVRAGVGDFDLSGSVDDADFAQLQACFNGPNEPFRSDCEFVDMDADADVDMSDFVAFRGCFNGADNPPACVPPPPPPPPPLPPGPPEDIDRDGDVDLADYARYSGCFNGPNKAPASPGCTDADFDGDNDVDLTDFGRFGECFNGPNQPASC